MDEPETTYTQTQMDYIVGLLRQENARLIEQRDMFRISAAISRQELEEFKNSATQSNRKGE
jgi:hypothetical protein